MERIPVIRDAPGNLGTGVNGGIWRFVVILVSLNGSGAIEEMWVRISTFEFNVVAEIVELIGFGVVADSGIVLLSTLTIFEAVFDFIVVIAGSVDVVLFNLPFSELETSSFVRNFTIIFIDSEALDFSVVVIGSFVVRIVVVSLVFEPPSRVGVEEFTAKVG